MQLPLKNYDLQKIVAKVLFIYIFFYKLISF